MSEKKQAASREKEATIKNDLNKNHTCNSINKEEEKIIETMNKKYAIVHTNSTHVLVEKDDNTFVLDSKKSIVLLHENDIFVDSKGKSQNKANFWFKHPNRRSYKDIVFDPVRPGHYEGNYNIFTGFSVIPKKRDCSLFWEHVSKVICNGDESHYQYVRKWMACVIQKPDLLATALVLKGLQGTGKNKFVEYFGEIFGKYFLTITSLNHLLGRFNSHLQNAYLILANEAIWGGDRREIGALKSIITDPTIFIEAKGKDGLQIQNCRHLIICTNEDWAVHMDLDDRRFFVLDVSSIHKEDTLYFKKLTDHMSNGGVEALLFDLLNENLDSFNPRIMPANEAGFDMKMKSASTSEKYIYEALKIGAWNLASADSLWNFNNKSFQDLYLNYKDWCEMEGFKNEYSSQFGKALKKLIPSMKKTRPLTDDRVRQYIFPSLEECRLEFQQFTKQTEKIWNDNLG